MFKKTMLTKGSSYHICIITASRFTAAKGGSGLEAQKTRNSFLFLFVSNFPPSRHRSVITQNPEQWTKSTDEVFVHTLILQKRSHWRHQSEVLWPCSHSRKHQEEAGERVYMRGEKLAKIKEVKQVPRSCCIFNGVVPSLLCSP